MTPRPEPAAASALKRRVLFGLPFVDAPDIAVVVEHLLASDTSAWAYPLVVTPNVDHLVKLRSADEPQDRPALT